MTHPYTGLETRAFWRNAISELHPLAFREIYRPKFEISSTTKVAAAGSCFAQHISRQFKDRKYTFLDVEPPPALLPKALWHQFGYDLYSARYGNIYSVRQLLQLVQRAFGLREPPDNAWSKNGRWFDPFRPAIEPNGFETEEELRVFNAILMDGVKALVQTCDVFVFTFGLTEAWIDSTDGSVYATCPGTTAGKFDPARHRFHNFTCAEVLQDSEAFIDLVSSKNPSTRFLLTVSPVPLVATAAGAHVLPATVYSKSVLRAACGELEQRYPSVDYFPSYEMVASHPYRAMFFDPNLRSVSTAGVAYVMNAFFGSHGSSLAATEEQTPDRSPRREAQADDDLVCEEVILEAFGR